MIYYSLEHIRRAEVISLFFPLPPLLGPASSFFKPIGSFVQTSRSCACVTTVPPQGVRRKASISGLWIAFARRLRGCRQVQVAQNRYVIPAPHPRIPASRCGVKSVRGVNLILLCEVARYVARGSLVSTLLRLRPEPLIKL